MKKSVVIIIILIFSIFSFSNNFSYSFGIAVSGALFPYLGINYNMDNIKIGGSLGFIFGPDDKNPEQWDYMFSPAFNIDYFVMNNFSIGVNTRMLVVIPYQYEQLYLTGIGIKYGIPINDNFINLILSGNYIIPISAGERSWEKGRDMKPYIPIPFIQGEYEF
jgi:hypothetical protein